MSVKLRKRKLSDGRISLYLDIYVNGERQYDFLKLYLGKDRNANRETIRLAESIRAKRELELNSRPHGFVPHFKQRVDFVKYFEKIADTKNPSNTPWPNTLKHLKAYTGGSIQLSAVDEKSLESFRDYLLSQVAQTSARVYFGTIRHTLNQAVRARLLPNNPFNRVDHIPPVETERAFLTIEEIRSLAEASCKYPEVQRAFLFSCFTGLRVSDIRRLTWSNVQQIGSGWTLGFRQKKRDRPEYLPLSRQARRLLNEPDNPDTLIFDLPRSLWTIEKVLREWADEADIEKHLTFHVARHTFATLALTNDVDLFTVSKLLGHTDISTTQIYANIIDKKKQDAVNRLPEIEL